MKMKLIDIFELLTYITTILNLLLESDILFFINLIVIMAFVTLVMYEKNRDNKECKEDE